ncbi:MAG: Gx transporter family protein [Dethiobacter sp.]|jgi:heptaprenyl diphosphate synthase|nr:MAG: Gx transporter family protein [Dethiobacter sp.]
MKLSSGKKLGGVKRVIKGKTFKMVYLALLVAFAVAVHTVEAAIPAPIPVPGAKLGLANIITLFAIVLYGYRSGLVVASLRSIIGSFLVGNFMGFGFYLSFSGAVLSCLAMALFINLYKRRKITLISVSLAGAVTFNIVQLVLASILVQNFILFRGYLPFLLLLAVPTGIFTGMVTIYLEEIAGRVGLQLKHSF